MNRHIEYLKAVLRHKYFVFVACMRLRVPLLIALLHDWDKFLPHMWFSYAATFFNTDGSKRPYERGKETVAFMKAWKSHQQRNKHHWQAHLTLNGLPIAKSTMLVMDNGQVKDITERNSGGEFWTEVRDVPVTVALIAPMPDVYIREMLGDWIGAGLAYGNPNTQEWYEQNKDKMKLHPRTRMYLEVEMKNYFHKYPLSQD